MQAVQSPNMLTAHTVPKMLRWLGEVYVQDSFELKQQFPSAPAYRRLPQDEYQWQQTLYESYVSAWEVCICNWGAEEGNHMTMHLNALSRTWCLRTARTRLPQPWAHTIVHNATSQQQSCGGFQASGRDRSFLVAEAQHIQHRYLTDEVCCSGFTACACM